MTEPALPRVAELARSVRMLATIGGALKLRTLVDVDAEMRGRIERAAERALGAAPSSFAEVKLPQLQTMIDMAFAEGSELLRDPARGPGWQITDPDILQAQGRASASVFDRILALSETRPLLRQALSGRFLDVGTGVGAIALRAAEAGPTLEVLGIDIWPPAVAIAKRNVAASPFAARIGIDLLDVADLPATPRYSLAWLPTMFLQRAVVRDAIARIAATSRPGAFLVAGLYTVPPDPFLAEFTALRTLRSGGEITDSAELAAMLEREGLGDIEVDRGPVVTFVVARTSSLPDADHPACL